MLIRLVLATATLAVLGACASTPDNASATDDLTSGANAAPLCNPLAVKASPLADAIALLEASGDLPMPSLAPDADGFFHPPSGYAEGGRFRVATAKAEWEVDPSEIQPPARAGTLRVVQWNVERGNQLDKAVRLMKKINADVWTINESDLYGKNSGGVVVAREIAKALGYAYYTSVEFDELRDDRRGTSGNAILSRFPIAHAESMAIPTLADQGGHDWSTDPDEPRCGQRSAIGARILAPSASGGTTAITVVALHTENKANPAVREAQFAAVTAKLAKPGVPTIVAGDLNTTAGGEPSAFRGFLGGQSGSPLVDCSRGDDTPTWTGPNVTSIFLKLHLDWTLLQPGTSGALDCPAGSYRVANNDSASDHKPVVTELTLR